jgi:hypothetical protein
MPVCRFTPALLLICGAVAAAQPPGSKAVTTPGRALVAPARGALQDAAYVERFLVSASRAINRARQVASLRPTSRFQKLFIQAENALAGAERALRGGGTALARQLGQRTLDLLDPLLATLTEEEDLRREIARAAGTVEAVRRRQSESADAQLRHMMSEAVRSVDEAREAYYLGRTEIASAKAKAGARTARKVEAALDGRAGDRVSPDRVEADRRIREAEEGLLLAERKIGTAPDLLGLRLLDEARRYLDRARTFSRKGQLASAASNGRLAAKLAAHAQARLSVRARPEAGTTTDPDPTPRQVQ